MNVIYQTQIKNFYNHTTAYFFIQNQFIKNKDILKNEPIILLNDDYDKNNYYSVILFDLDSSFLHWWIVNYNLKNPYFETWINYLSPFENNHRYIFYLFSQDYLINKPNYVNPYYFRANFNVKENINKLKLKLVDTKYFIF